MCLHGVGFSNRPQRKRQVPTTSGHMPNAGQEHHIRYQRRTQEVLCYRLLFAIRYWHEACTRVAERGGSQLVAETDSAANHYGQLRAENQRHISVFCGPCSAPRIF